MDDHTRDAAEQAIVDIKLRLEQALAVIDREPDNVLALELVVVHCRAVIQMLECPVEE